MRLLFLVKFYEPFDRGGSEWSTHDLAVELCRRGHKVTILTPNYGAKGKEIKDKVQIYRIPFPKKLKIPKSSITPWWTNNLVWFIYSTLFCIFFLRKNKYDLIHIQNNEFIPAGYFAAKIYKLKQVVTFRDYQVICNLSFCLWHNTRSCNLKNYLTKDFKFYYLNYVENKNIFKFILLLAAVIRGKIIQSFLKIIANKIENKVAVSNKLREIFEDNGFNGLKVIHNPVILKTKPTVSKKTSQILYLGKLSPGKGAKLFFDIIPSLLKKISRANFKFIGSGILKEALARKAKELNILEKIEFSGQIEHADVLIEAAKSALVVVPSIWPEPLPRSAIETLLVGTPIAATNVGGIPEVIVDNLYGILSRPNEKDLERAILTAYRKREQIRKNILADSSGIKKHFSSDPVKNYLKIYKQA